MYRETRFVTNYRRPPPFPRLHYLNVTNHPDDHYYFQNFFFETDLLFRLNIDRLCSLSQSMQMQNIFLIILSHQYRSHTSSLQFFHLSILFDSDSTRTRKIRELTCFQEWERDRASIHREQKRLKYPSSRLLPPTSFLKHHLENR